MFGCCACHSTRSQTLLLALAQPVMGPIDGDGNIPFPRIPPQHRSPRADRWVGRAGQAAQSPPVRRRDTACIDATRPIRGADQGWYPCPGGSPAQEPVAEWSASHASLFPAQGAFDCPMNIIRIHHRSRRRILVANVVSMIVIGPFLFGIASLWNFQGFPMWLASLLFVVNMAFFGANTWTVAHQSRDFVCLLTDERLVCQSPDESLARTFDVPLAEISRLTEVDQTEGGPRYSIHTNSGETFPLTYNFGNPAWSFFEGLREVCPTIPVEKS